MLVSVVSPKKICLFLQLSLAPDALLVSECWLDLAPNVINGGCTPLGKRWRAPSSRVNVRAVPIDRWIDNYMERYRRASVHRCQSALLSIECHLAVYSLLLSGKKLLLRYFAHARHMILSSGINWSIRAPCLHTHNYDCAERSTVA